MGLQRLQVSKFGPFVVTASAILLGHAKFKRHRKNERFTSAYFPYNFSGVCPVSRGVWLPEPKRGWCPGNQWWNRVFAIVFSHPSNKGKAAQKSMEKFCYCSVRKTIVTVRCQYEKWSSSFLWCCNLSYYLQVMRVQIPIADSARAVRLFAPGLWIKGAKAFT